MKTAGELIITILLGIVVLFTVYTIDTRNNLSNKEMAEYNKIYLIKEELDTEIDYKVYQEFLNIFINRNRASIEVLEEELKRLVDEQTISREITTDILESRRKELADTPIVGVDESSLSDGIDLDFEDSKEDQRNMLISNNENLEIGRISVYNDRIVFRFNNILLQSMYFTLEIDNGKVVGVYENN